MNRKTEALEEEQLTSPEDFKRALIAQGMEQAAEVVMRSERLGLRNPGAIVRQIRVAAGRVARGEEP